MKKLICVLCCVALSAGLAGCMGKAPIGKGKAPAPVMTKG
jgi:hypothetical protein